ncbi:MAG: hypothetical protein CVV10_05715 [Gammaproteobacteria bacterium HGW-Gammaproteobacteria-14]|nr:MAG: hypothetical protein CVV10_05715 [Gammaproteobacteria bacterium HGW-Gammaproteobacteria-14]
MGFNTVPLLIMVFCLAFVVAGSIVLLRNQWFIQWLKGTGGLLLIGLAVYFSLFAVNLFSYKQLSRDVPVATISFRSTEPQAFIATVSQADAGSTDYKLTGDLWQIDARIIRWKGLFAVLGFQPGYQLDRLQGRYLSLEDELNKTAMSHQIVKPAVGFDIWSSARNSSSLMIDAQYASVTFLPMADGAIYEVLLTSNGLAGRPLNGAAQQAVGRWE